MPDQAPTLTPATRAFVKAIRDSGFPYRQFVRAVNQMTMLSAIAESEAGRAVGQLPPQPPIEWIEQLCAISQERADQRRRAIRDRQARRRDIMAAIIWFVAVLAVGLVAGH